MNRRNLSDMVRVELALASKSIIEARAKGNQVASQNNNAGRAVRLNSDELVTPTRTDTTITQMAGVDKDTVRKVEAIREHAIPAVQEVRPSQPSN